jgi:hypothetical protein
VAKKLEKGKLVEAMLPQCCETAAEWMRLWGIHEHKPMKAKKERSWFRKD